MIQTTGTPPRIALIGVSGYAEVYIEWLLKAQSERIIEVTAATILPNEQDLPTARAIKQLAPTIYESYESMFSAEEGKLDISFIPTGIQWHAPMTIAALEAGSNVLVEKPLAGSVADVERLQAAEKKSGRWIAVGFQDMYTSQILELKQSLIDGAIGKIESISMIAAWPRPKDYYARNIWAGKLMINGQATFDSPLNNALAHFVNLSLFLAGAKPKASASVSVQSSELYSAHEIESFDTAVVRAFSEEDISFWFGVTHACSKTIEPQIRIKGSIGEIVWEHEKNCTLFLDSQEPIVTPVPRYAQTRQNMFESVIKRFYDSKIPICDTNIAKSHTQLIKDIHSSGTIQTLSPEFIETVQTADKKSSIPAIKEIEQRLLSAFQNNSELGDLNAQPLNA